MKSKSLCLRSVQVTCLFRHNHTTRNGIEINGLRICEKSNVAQPGYFATSPDTKGLLYQYLTRPMAMSTPQVRKKTIINLMASEREHGQQQVLESWKRILVRKAGEFPEYLKKYKDDWKLRDGLFHFGRTNKAVISWYPDKL